MGGKQVLESTAAHRSASSMPLNIGSTFLDEIISFRLLVNGKVAPPIHATDCIWLMDKRGRIGDMLCCRIRRSCIL
jgi:hypothetical protein